jgi:cell wall-associated NlpC family hydrolase
MEYAACRVPAAPIRKRSDHKTEMVNQVLFGETMMVLKEKKKWARIRTTLDNYEGWISLSQLEEITEETAITVSEWIPTDLFNVIDIANNKMNISFGASLLGWDMNNGKLGKMGYGFTGNKIRRNEIYPDAKKLIQFTHQWLNAPYLWGGRTPLGVDCSGFAQIIFKTLGIDLKRDAWQQAQQGKPVKKLKDAITGDLAFFDDREEIVHVGILLNSEQIIHASGRVRIDPIDKKGITNSDTGKRTHRLRAIRRYW